MRTPALDAAFRATSYRVDDSRAGFDLRIGVVNPVFDDFLRARGVSRWGVLTAHNPGALCADADNARRQERFLERLRELGWTFLPACNVAADGVWPAEPGALILAVDEPALRALAAEFSQLAFVCGEVGGAPRLVWL
jgi:hypothetical protein